MTQSVDHTRTTCFLGYERPEVIHQPPIGIVSGCVPHQWCITPAWNQPRPSDHHYILQIINLKDKSMLGVLFQLTILCDLVACWSLSMFYWFLIIMFLINLTIKWGTPHFQTSKISTWSRYTTISSWLIVQFWWLN